MAVALRLAAYELLRSEGVEPVLLLDDVFAELDTARRKALAGVADGAEQVLVTAAVPTTSPPRGRPAASRSAWTTATSGRASVVDVMTRSRPGRDGATPPPIR